MSAKVVYYLDSQKADSKLIINLLLVSSLAPEISMLIISASKYKFGIQYNASYTGWPVVLQIDYTLIL